MLDNQKINNVIFIAVFLGLIFGPMLGKIASVGEISAKEFMKKEKRLPCQYPKYPTSIPELKKYPLAFEHAFNDHLPFREILIMSYGELSVNLLKFSPHKQLLIGRNGHCFLASHGNGDNDLIFESIEIDSKTIAQMADGLRKKESFLKDLKIPALMLAIPTSPLLEFHNLPFFIQKQIDPAFLVTPPAQRVIDKMPKEFSKKYLLFPYKETVEANKDYPLFPEKNFHWQTSRYTKLVAGCIAERFGIAPYEKPGFDEFEKQQTVSDLSRFSGTQLINRNDMLYKLETWEKLGIRNKNPAEVYRRYPAFPGCSYTVNQSQKRKVLLVGDSFTPALKFDLARHFGEVLSVNFNLALKNTNIKEWFRCVFEDIQPDYIVFIHHNSFFIHEKFIEYFYSSQAYY